MSYKLYIISNNNKLLKFNEHDNNTITETDILKDNLGIISFEYIQLFLIVEYKIAENSYIYINPYTGKCLLSEKLSTETINDAVHHWEKIREKKILRDKSNTHINITFNALSVESIRIIWSNLGIGIINSQIPLKDYIIIENGLVVHNSYHNIDREVDDIISSESTLLRRVPANRSIIITSGSQAAGKSHFFMYERGSNESIANYDAKQYYNVDSDRYFGFFNITKEMNKIPIKYKNFKGNAVNSAKYLVEVLRKKRNPHKHIEWRMEQICIDHNINFIKQGTSLWLNNMMENENYKNYNKQILMIWINKELMRPRLNQRLSDTQNIRYFYKIESSLEQYNSDWHAIANQIMNIHFYDIFSTEKKYKFCFIFNHIQPPHLTCFDENMKIIKRGMDPIFFIKLLLSLSYKEYKLSHIPESTLKSNDVSLLRRMTHDDEEKIKIVFKTSAGSAKIIQKGGLINYKTKRNCKTKRNYKTKRNCKTKINYPFTSNRS